MWNPTGLSSFICAFGLCNFAAVCSRPSAYIDCFWLWTLSSISPLLKVAFGLSIGDFIRLFELSKGVVDKCKSAGEEFSEAGRGAQNLHIILKSIEAEIQDQDSVLQRDEGQVTDSRTIMANCSAPLANVKNILSKHQPSNSLAPRFLRSTIGNILTVFISTAVSETIEIREYGSGIGIKDLSILSWVNASFFKFISSRDCKSQWESYLQII